MKKLGEKSICSLIITLCISSGGAYNLEQREQVNVVSIPPLTGFSLKRGSVAQRHAEMAQRHAETRVLVLSSEDAMLAALLRITYTLYVHAHATSYGRGNFYGRREE